MCENEILIWGIKLRLTKHEASGDYYLEDLDAANRIIGFFLDFFSIFFGNNKHFPFKKFVNLDFFSIFFSNNKHFSFKKFVNHFSV